MWFSQRYGRSKRILARILKLDSKVYRILLHKDGSLKPVSGRLTVKFSGGLRLFEARACIECLDVPHVSDSLFTLHEDWISGTCEWFWSQRHSAVSEWLSAKGSNILTITGNIGCGKTILIAYLHKELRKRRLNHILDSKRIVCSFPCNDVPESQRNPLAIIASFLSQAIVQDEDGKILRHATESYEGLGKGMASSFVEMWKLFEIAVKETATTFFIMIDAVDKADLKSCNMLLKKLETLSVPCRNLKIIVTFAQQKRYDVGISESSNLLSMTDEAENDVATIVSARLQEIAVNRRISQKTVEQLKTKVLDGASGNLLWAIVVLGKIESSPSTNPQKLNKLVENVSANSNLREVYSKVLHEVLVDGASDATKALQILACAFRPLSLPEMQFAMAVEMQHKSLVEVQEYMEENIQDFIYSLLGGLVRIKKGRVRLVHDSLRDYLTEIWARNATSHSLQPDDAFLGQFCFDTVSCHLTISRACIATINIGGISDASPLIDDPFSNLALADTDDKLADAEANSLRSNTSDGATDHSFFRYASQYWAIHFANCCDYCDDDLTVRSIELSQNNVLADQWIKEYKWAETDPLTTKFWPTDGVDPLLIASHFNHAKVISKLIKQESSYTHGKYVWHSIMTAAHRGYQRCLDLLLPLDSLYGNELEFGHSKESAACLVAAERGNLSIVEYLVARGANLEYTGIDTGWNALAVAVNSLHEELVGALLPLSNVTIKPCGALFASVQYYARKTPEDTVRERKILEMLFADPRIDWTQRDLSGRTFLSYAAERGFHEAIDLVERYLQPFIMQSWIADRGDKLQRTAVWHAVNGNYAVFVDKLSKHGDLLPQICVQGPELETALARACRRGQHTCVAVLIKLDPQGKALEILDECLNSPLHIAAMSGNAESVRLLLGTQMVATERQNETGDVPLQKAIAAGSLASVQALLEHGADPLKAAEESHDGELRLKSTPPFQHLMVPLMNELKYWWKR